MNHEHQLRSDFSHRTSSWRLFRGPWNDSNGDGNYTSSSPDEETERTHNFANEIEEIGGTIPFAYDKAGNMTEQGLPATATKYYTHDAWNRLTEVKINAAVLGQYEYNALHWRSVKRARSPAFGSLDEMRLMYYSANWQLLDDRIDRSWTSGFTEVGRATDRWYARKRHCTRHSCFCESAPHASRA